MPAWVRPNNFYFLPQWYYLLMKTKRLLYGIFAIVIIGVGGLVYRNAVEYPSRQTSCPVPTLTCPDGTSVPHLVNSCDFPACPPPNVSFPDVRIAFALPEGLIPAANPDAASIATYELPDAPERTSVIIRRFAISASSTALATIQQTAIGGASGEPVPITAYSSTVLGRSNNFTVVAIERFEGVIDTAYYLARSTDVLRFDAIDHEVMNWTDPNLNLSLLPANAALRKLLATLEAE
jgi:hypothetical protein